MLIFLLNGGMLYVSSGIHQHLGLKLWYVTADGCFTLSVFTNSSVVMTDIQKELHIQKVLNKALTISNGTARFLQAQELQ